MAEIEVFEVPEAGLMKGNHNRTAFRDGKTASSPFGVVIRVRSEQLRDVL